MSAACTRSLPLAAALARRGAGARLLGARPGSAPLDWTNLGFEARPVAAYVRYNWKGGAWDDGALQPDGNVTIHALSNALNYGQAVFEGLKALQCKDGSVALFNPRANLARLTAGCARLQMPAPPAELFLKGLERAVAANAAYVPPYGTGGALYLRPLLFGHGAQLGLGAAPEYCLMIAPNPVGAYYSGGLHGVDAIVVEDYDRAAPRGVGAVKAAGNYAPDVLPSRRAKAAGYSVCLYLDARTNTHVEEFSTSNFIGVTKDGTVVTPASPSILPSCTREVVLQAARDLGLKAEHRPVRWDEVRDLAEAAACGTAVVLTPMRSITRGSEVVRFHGFETVQRLFAHISALQAGDAPDPHGYRHVVAL
ncbi:hypothetical protein KFE25_012641 [Diacronema lutheri]|uniref:Branched-chain-amino-acid transaminase n=2 Tax=Diacronema lutheri TaxID=2081491 RepID=A0A8J6C5A2_DIALT|nr:hypothetical protein KFE25_012641 [Diacronema lutheri]